MGERKYGNPELASESHHEILSYVLAKSSSRPLIWEVIRLLAGSGRITTQR
ncbi:hypothetical protein RchiOBHm_Chr2g0119511 [Rosa chinensis]|nr:hypothetical protein RchiOBHm_Chr2g0119511 [Rosa chinensis]